MFDISRQKFSPQTQPISNQFRIHSEMESQSANVAPQITKRYPLSDIGAIT